MTAPRPQSVVLRSSGLFGPQELWRLVAAEFERARRHGFPLSALAVGVDRLGALHDLYGRDSKREIRRSVQGFFTADRRSSDLFLELDDDRMVVLVPHASLDGVRAMVRRLQRGARRLRFEGEHRALEITLSAGLCHGRGDELRDVDAFLATALEAQSRASSLGGDRLIEDRPPTPRPAAPAKGGDERLAELVQRLDEVGGGTGLVGALLELMAERKRGAGEGPAAAPPPPPAAPAAPAARPGASAPRPVSAGALPPAPAVPDGGVGGPGEDNLALLERRMAKMADLLARVEQTLAGLSGPGARDEGIAPVQRARVETLGAVRKELMGRIFEANLALRREVERRGGDPDQPPTALSP